MKRCLLLCLTLALGGCFFSSPPSDEEMIHSFKTHKVVFEQLVAMACHDGYSVVSMDPEWSRPENIPNAKKQKYYKLFRAVGVTQLQSYAGCRAQLSVWSVGLGGSGDYKDYQYRPDKVENQVASLDHLKLGDRIEFFYRKVAPDWYIRYAHWP